jgi:hypothetical protein
MKIRWWVVLAVVVVPALVFAGNKKKVPAQFGNAKYVYVVSEDGDIYTPGLLQEDRQAILDVEGAIRDWKRYTLTARLEEAELVFIVRKGRLATGKLGGTIGTPNPQPGQPGQPQLPGQQRFPNGPGGMAGAEAGPPDDLMEVWTMGPDGKRGARLWFRTQTDGLEAPRVPLLRDLRDAVEKDYPQ